MLLHRFHCLAGRLEQIGIGHQRQGNIDKIGQLPLCAGHGSGLADPTEYLLDTLCLGGRHLHAHQFSQGVDLVLRQ